MSTHVFIVDANTFKIHLEYLFAGTGASDKIINFINNPEARCHHTTERNLVSMIADASRIRKDDMIIFYVQQNYQLNTPEGKFYGIFKASEDLSFLDDNDDKQYQHEKLGKSLTFRTLVEPSKVYPEGVTEWEALDEIKGIQSPNQMQWSLIYRKLKGNRGNTMITIYESEKLCQLIRDKNNKNVIHCADKMLSFDKDAQKIICLDTPPNKYAGRKDKLNILPRLATKYNKGQAFESHLQAYIMQSIGLKSNQSLDDAIVANSPIEWIGNEVSCGVGMQRIDIMISSEINGTRTCIPIELKATQADPYNIVQIQRYVDWIQQYYLPNSPSDIRPTLITKKINDKSAPTYQEIVRSFQVFNNKKSPSCNNLKYIEYELVNDDLLFSTVEY